MNNVAKAAGLDQRVVVLPNEELVDSTRNCGIEIEIENISARSLRTSLPHWDVGDDHSLRPVDFSAEIRTPGRGQCGNALVDGLREYTRLGLPDALDRHFSWRTGLHVHVDVRDFTDTQIRLLATKYALLEPAIFAYAGHGRHESRFSMPWWVVSHDVDRITGMVMPEGASVQPFRNAVHNFSKYTALNMHTITRLGTVEFRHAQACQDYNYILGYTNIALGLVESCNVKDACLQREELLYYYGRLPYAQFITQYVHPRLVGVLSPPTSRDIPNLDRVLEASLDTAMYIGLLSDMYDLAAPTKDDADLLYSSLHNPAAQWRRLKKFSDRESAYMQLMNQSLAS